MTRVLSLSLLLCATSLSAQNRFPPDSLVNVKVFPRTTPPREVVNTMRGFTNALGVRCTYCHVGQEGQPLGSYDFASDERRAKLVAREMMRMVETINTQTIAAIPGRADTGLRVTCTTCHRGVARPVPLERLVTLTVAGAGTDSAIRLYRGLRDRYYGQDAYDFGEQTLIDAALTLSQARNHEAALALLALDNEYYPQGSDLMVATGEVERARGDTAAAIRAYREALARNPRNPSARQRLTQLGQQP